MLKFFVFQSNLMIIYIYSSKILNPAFKTSFLVHNDHWNFCGYVENSKWILCTRKKVFFLKDFKCTNSVYLHNE